MATEEITAVFIRETHRWDDTCIAEFRYSNGTGVPSLLPVKLQADVDELRSHSTYRLYGTWSEYANKRLGTTVKQFHAKTFIRSAPHGREGIIRYLVEAPGIGPATAQKLWDAFGSDAVRIVRETPDVAVAAVGGQFTLERAKQAAAYLETEKALEGCSLDLVDLLGGRGFPKSTPKKCLKEWGNMAAARIRRSPYILMQFKGCGFIRCDQLYLDLGHNPNALKRQALAAWYVLARDTEGHTWLSADAVEEGMRRLVRFADPIPALKLAKRAGIVAVRRDEAGNVWLAEGKRARQETTVAEHAAAMAARPGEWPAVDELDVSEHQREQARRALQSQMAILCGSPGTGKTYTAARIIKVLCDLWGADAIGVCAPTGKAASRISEAMAGYGLPLQGRTIHSTLGVGQHNEEGEWGFVHGPGNPLPFRVLVVDESSMIDTSLMASLLSACAPGTHVLLIGDTNQLPPVGHGAPLRDLIAAGVSCGELREIRRNSGTIVRACAMIRDGEAFETDAVLDPDAGQNLKVIETSKPETTADRIIDTIRRLAAGGITDPIWGCQVIVAVNKKSILSRKDLNKTLQGMLNPDGYTTGGNPFRVGDKIVCLKNSFLKAMDEGDADNLDEETGEPLEIFVANGELLKVVDVGEKWTAAEITCGPWAGTAVRVPRGKADAEGDSDKGGGSGGGGGGDDGEETSSTGCQFDLGYAISCHKSQGSEWPVVIVVLDDYAGARRVCSREWLYTAISRGKTACLLIGPRRVAESMVHRVALVRRKTFARELVGARLKGGA